MKKLLSVAGVVGLLVGLSASIVSAAPKEREDGSRPNDHGMCTAYFNGQKNGWDKKDRSPGPFQYLEAGAEDGDDENETVDAHERAAAAFDYCDGLIGGNMAHGRWACVAGQEDDPATPADESTDTTCEHTDGPGNS